MKSTRAKVRFIVFMFGAFVLFAGALRHRSEAQSQPAAQTNDLLQIVRNPIMLTNGQQLLALSFFSDSNHNYVVEYRDDLGFDLCNQWHPVANAPHNYGIVFATNTPPQRFFRLRRIDQPRAPLFALLANDTGTNSLDGLTADPTITGLALQFPENSVLQAALDHTNGAWTVIASLDHPRYLLITSNHLAQLNGGSLPDGPHILYLRTEGSDASAQHSVSFVLDTTPPTVSLRLATDSDSPPVGDGRTTFNPVTLTGQTDPGQTVEMLPSGIKSVADTNGIFIFTNITLADGTNQFWLRALDAACNESVANHSIAWLGPLTECAFDGNLSGWTVQAGNPQPSDPLLQPVSGSVTYDPDCGALMLEGDSFLVTLSRTFDLPSAPATLSFSYSILSFDATATNKVKDAFEAALVDSSGRPLTYTIQGTGGVAPASSTTPAILPASPDAFFNHTEGHTPFIAPGAALKAAAANPQLQTVAVDISQRAPGSTAKLILRLVNNDPDHSTSVRITGVRFEASDPTLNLAGSPGTALALLGRSAIVADSESVLTGDCARNLPRATNGAPKIVLGARGSPTLAVETPADNSHLAPGVTLLTGYVLADHADISPGEPATNRVMIVAVNGQPVDAVDAAGNFYSVVGIRPGPNIFEVTATDALEQTTTNTLTVIGTTCPDSFTSLGVVSASVEPDYGRTSFSEQTRTLYAELALRNAGSYRMRAPFYVGVTRISNPTVRLLAADGLSADDIPYYDFSSTITNSALDPGQTSLGRTLAFHNPNHAQFSYELVVLGHLNHSPSFRTVPPLEAIVGRTYTYPFNASDPDGDALSFILSASPTNLSLNAQLKILNWLPTAADIGNHDIRLRADDGRGGTAEQHYLLSVVPPPSNRPPHFISTPVSVARISTNILSVPQEVDLSHWSVIQLQTNSPDQGPANWVIGPSNTVATQQRNADASILLSDFPLVNDEIDGLWRVGAGGDDDYMGFVFGYQDRTHFYLFDWKAGNQGDPCGTALAGMNVKVISAETELDCRDLWPSVITNDRVRTLFHNSVPWERERDYAFTLQFASGEFAIQILDGTNLLESVQITDATYTNGAFGFYNYSQGNITYRGFARQRLVDSTYAYNADAADPDDDTLTYSLVAAPDGMRIDAILGLVRWEPTAEQIGMHFVSLQVTDGRGGLATQSYVVCALDPSVNQPQANSPPVIITTPPSSAVAGLPYRYVIRAQDAERQLLSISAPNAPAGAAIRTIDAGSAGTGIASFDWISTLAQLGTNSVTILVRDSAGAETQQTFAVDVVASAPNRPPGFVSRPRSQTRLTIPYTYLVEAFDPDGDPLTIELLSGPSGLVLTNAEPNVPNSGFLIWTPSAVQVRTNFVELRVSDGRGGTSTQPFAINVRTTLENESPAIVSLPPLHATEGQPYEYNLAASDPDEDLVIYRLVHGPPGLSLDAQSGTLRWVPTLDQLGTNSVIIEVLDVLLATDVQAWTIEVGCVNRPPQITSTPPVETSTDSLYLYALQATDPDGDSITFDFAETNQFPTPVGMTLTNLASSAQAQSSPGLAGALLRWTPATNQVGPHLIHVRVSDNRGGTDTQTYTLYVGNIRANKAPVAVSAPSRGAPLGQTYTYTFRATDSDGDTLTLQSLLPLPPGASFASTLSSPGQAEGILAWTPTAGGSQDFILTARDPSGASASQRFTVTARANAPPQITSSPRTNATLNATYLYDLSAFDSDGDSLAFALTGPAGMFINSFGQISWTPNQSQFGDYPVTVSVTDDFGGTAGQSFAVTVSTDTEPPSVELALIQGLISPENGQWAGDLGTKVVVQVKSTDNVGIGSQSLHFGSTEIPLGGNGIGSISVDRGGLFNLTGVATDLAGNTNSVTRPILFRDPLAESHISVRIHTPTNEAVITTPIPIIATITNDIDLVSYSWGYALVAEIDPRGVSITHPAFTIVGTTNLPVGTRSLQNVTIGTFDPTVLQNDSYVLAVAAIDSNGNGWTEPVAVSTDGNLKFGEFQLAFTDLAMPLAGIPIQVKRVYDSRLAGRIGDFGYGWALGVQDAIIRESVPPGTALRTDSRVYLTGPDGRRLGFTFAPIVESSSLFGALFRPQFQADPGGYDRLEVRDEVFSFQGAGLIGDILEVLDPYNPSTYFLTTKDHTRYEYEETRGLQSVTDLNGNSVTFTADAIKHSAGPEVQLARDPSGRIIKIVAPDGKTWTYQYDAAGDLVRLTYPGSIVATFGYSTNRPHFLETINDPIQGTPQRTEYDENGRLTAIIDATGNRIEQTWDPASFTGTYTGARGNVTQLAYDARGNITRRQDPLGGVTTWEYTDPKNPDLETAMIDPRGHRTTYTYDARGNLLQAAYPLGVSTTYVYDAQDRIISEIHGTGRVDFEYDVQDNLTHYKSPIAEWVLTYTADGRLASTLDGEGGLTRFEYEGALPLASRIVAPDGSISQFAYDRAGRMTNYIDALGQVTQIEYDSSGRRVRQIDPNGGTFHIAYDSAFPLKESAITNRAGRVTQFSYDNVGRLTERREPGGATTRYEYDAEDNRTAVVDPLTNRYEFAYDAMNRLVEETDPLGTKRLHRYDPAGNRVNSLNRNGRKRSFVYDALNRATQEHWHDPDDDSVVRTITFQYDDFDRITEASDPDATLRRSWFPVPNERLLSERTTYPGLPERLVELAYDKAGGRSELSVNGVLDLRLTRDLAGQLHSLTSTGENPNIASNVWRLEFWRNALGQVTELRRFADENGNTRVSTTTYENSTCGCGLDAIQHRDASSQPLPGGSMSFTRDPDGQITGLLDGSNTLSFAYDAAAQLTGAMSNGVPSESYSYDANGNRLASHLQPSYTISPGNRLAGSTDYILAYDPEGNLITKSNRLSGDLLTFTWDYRNRLTQVMKTNSTSPGASFVTDYRYDALDRRIAVIRNGQTNWTYYDDEQPLMEYLNNDPNPVSLFFAGPGLDKLHAIWRRNEGIFWTLTDHLGSVRRIVDGNGVEVAALGYDSYGNLNSVAGSQPGAADSFAFTARERDGDTGLYYNRARYYDPELGRFISADPIEFESGDANHYRYVRNDPLRYTDPTGKTLSEYVQWVKDLVYREGLCYALGAVASDLVEVATGFSTAANVAGDIVQGACELVKGKKRPRPPKSPTPNPPKPDPIRNRTPEEIEKILKRMSAEDIPRDQPKFPRRN